MPILNMVGGGKKGGNIGEPLNLTVTTSGLDATITWEDNEIGTIPPTTFQKSELVRKIGSAPTSPSDGVLVVTETVKDTYKTTGYVDQGLTDGTTYYYRVFSYSDLGGISYCDAVSITTSSSWQPGAYWDSNLGLISVSSDGTNWITIQDKNVGADSVGSNGYYFQRGNNYGWSGLPGNVSSTKPDASGYSASAYSDSTFISCPSLEDWSSVGNDNLWGDTTDTNIARQGPCDSGYHVPTKNEFDTLTTICSDWGYTFGGFDTLMKIPHSGNINNTGTKITNVGGSFLWTSTPINGSSYRYTSAYNIGMGDDARCFGEQIRAFANTPTIPDATWTVLYQPS